MRHALTVALQAYEGGVVLVSHDRALLRASCDRFVLVADGKAQVFDGDLEDYRIWLAEQKAQDKLRAQPLQNELAKKNDKAQNKAERQARLAERRPLTKEAEQLESRMAEWQEQKVALEARLADGELYSASDKSELQQLLKKQAELAQQIEAAEERWLEVMAQLESMPAA